MKIKRNVLTFKDETESCPHSSSVENNTVMDGTGLEFGKVYEIEYCEAEVLSDLLAKFKGTGGELAMRPEVIFQDDAGHHYNLNRMRILPSRLKDVPVQVVLSDPLPNLKAALLVSTNKYPKALRHYPEVRKRHRQKWELGKNPYYIDRFGEFREFDDPEVGYLDDEKQPVMHVSEVHAAIDRHLSRFGEKFIVDDWGETVYGDGMFEHQYDITAESSNRVVRFHMVLLFPENACNNMIWSEMRNIDHRFGMRYQWRFLDHYNSTHPDEDSE